MKKTFAVTGATGNIGRRVAEGLLAHGHEVRVLGRDASRLQPLVDKGAVAVVGQPDDVATLVKGFRGADAVFAMIPPHFGAESYRRFQNEVGDATARALQESGVERVVNLSSIGAQYGDGVGVVKGLHDQEERLNALEGIHVIHLRPAFFLENLYFGVGLIEGQGIHGTPLEPEKRFPMIATVDIAQRALKRIQEPFTGKRVEELLGARDVSMAEITEALKKALGRPTLAYVAFPYEGAYQAMVGMGLAANPAAELVELYRSMNEGKLRPVTPRTTESTTATTVEAFAADFAKRFPHLRA